MDNAMNTEKKRSKKKKRKKSKNYLLRIIIAVLIIVAVICVLHVDYFKVDKIGISGNEYLTDKQILKPTKIKVGRNIFDVHILLEEHRIKKNVYVEDVEIGRKLPNKINIKVKEKAGLGQLVHGKKYIIIDNSGKVIEIANKPRNITIVEGFQVKSAELNHSVELASNKNFEEVMKLLAAVDKGDLYFGSVQLKGDRVSANIFGELKVTGAYKNVMDSLKSGTLKTVVYNLYQSGTTKGTIKVSGENYCSFTE